MRKSNLVRSVEHAFSEDVESLLRRLIIDQGYSVPEVARMIRQRGILLGEGTLYRWLKLLGYELRWGGRETGRSAGHGSDRSPRRSSQAPNDSGGLP